MENSDIIIDQLAHVSMGGISPEGMLSGKPVLSSYRDDICNWMYPKRPPIISVFNTKDIEKALINLINNSQKRKRIGAQSKKWFYENHSKKIVINTLLKTYKKLLKKS